MTRRYGWFAIRLLIACALFAPFAVRTQSTFAISSNVVIRQVYGGGGNTGATYTHDFIELFNRGTAAVSLNGWSLQYASATGTGNFGVNSGQLTELPNVSLAPGQYLLIQEASGTAGSPLPTPDVTDATPINMSGTAGKVALVNTATSLGCNGGSAPCSPAALASIIDLVGYGNANFFEGSPASTLSNSTAALRVSGGCTDTDNNASDFSTGTPAPRNSSSPLNPCGDETPTPTPTTPTPTPITPTPTPTTPPGGSCPSGVTLTQIPAIQGSGASSPFENTTVTLEGVVVGDFQGNAQLGGFYLQDPTGDGALSTSDGIFVFVPDANPNSSVDVDVGDRVRLTGQVKEFNTLTEIDNVTAVAVCEGVTPLAPTPVDLPVATASDMEHYEGMLVSFPEALTVSQNFFQGRYGQVHLSAEGRMYNPTNDQGNSADDNLRRSIVLDDGRTSQNPNPIPYISADNTLRAGDITTGLMGVMHYGPISSDTNIRGYTLHPTLAPSFTRANERTAAPEAVGGAVKIASFNVLNYFTTIDQSGASCFPSGTRSDCRGADSAAEFQRQRDKIIAAMLAIDADIVGLIEIENNGSTAIGNLVAGLNAASAPGTYAAVADPNPIGQPGDDAIKVALIYKPGRVTPVGASASSADPIFDRPPAAQTFRLNSNGALFSVVVNHFKSKGSCPSSASDSNADQGDGQGCWNAKRVEQAQALLVFINQLIAAAADPDVLVIGDLNSYGQEDPIDTLVTGGLVNQIALHVPLAERYSYVFDGQSGYLDHALATSSLSAQVSDATIWHINADEPSVIDYNTEFKPQDLYAPTPYRSSDHDPVVIGLNLATPNTAPTVDANGPYSVSEGGSVALNATGNDLEGGALSYAWDLDNDGVFETSGQSATFSAAGIEAPASRTVRVQVIDQGGLTATDVATINIVYGFSGFLQPVDNLPTLNMVNAGRSIPVKFSLSGDQGLAIFAAGSPTSQPIACDTTAPTDGVEETLGPGGSGLSYDASTDTYTYVWKTDKKWAGTCRQLIVELNDGTVHQANFQFSR